jgi:hypothetical protein
MDPLPAVNPAASRCKEIIIASASENRLVCPQFKLTRYPILASVGSFKLKKSGLVSVYLLTKLFWKSCFDWKYSVT